MKSKMRSSLRVKKFFAKMGQKFSGLVQRHQFTFLICCAIVTALALTSVSIYIYVASGAINIDLSRPGYESVREETSDEGDAAEPFSSSGEITEEVRADFLERLEIYRKEMSQMNDFGSDSLSNQALNLE